MARRIAALLLVVSLAALAPGVRAGEERSPYGNTYTPEELAALDRALHAANMTREDLRFRKDMTEGHACFTTVRDMLRDPLAIAPFLDGRARRAGSWMGPQGVTSLVHDAIFNRYEIPAEQDREPCLAGPRWSWADAETPTTPEALLAIVRAALEVSGDPHDTVCRIELLGHPLPDADLLRLALPPAMAWHDVFASPFDPERTTALEAELERKPDAWLHERMATVVFESMISAWHGRFGVEPALFLRLPASAFPTDEPLVVESVHGRIALGTPKDDVYTGDYTVLIDPGGNDRYEGCRLGAAYGTDHRRVAFFADLGGDDVYDCGDVDVTLGAAVLGVAAFFDLGQGNDRYVAGHCSLGAAMGGVATFYDDGGTDTYRGKTFTQGAAGFGVGIFYDDSVQAAPALTSDEGTPDPVDIGAFDNDRLAAWANAQAFARCRGVALCVNKRGNDVYEAGGVYLHAPLFADRYQSFSQGFAIGERGIDYAGGIAMLIDHDGNDRYLGDIYDQGVGYWYSAGLLWDGGGNDTYEMTQYGQGSGIHLAVGGLVDVAGHDTYVMHSGLGQGGSHDYAASILHDRGGNDRYLGNTSCNGSALTNSVGIQIDRSGDDLYAGRSSGSINFARPARGFASIAVLLDLGGKDDYLGIMADDTQWRHSEIGVGLDVAPEPVAAGAGGVTPAADQPMGNAEIPAVCGYEGELTQEVFDELWAISVRWEVGDNRAIVPKARERLIAFGPAVLPRMDAKVEERASGLELRAYVQILKALSEQDAEAVTVFLRGNLASDVERRKRIGLYLVGELKATGLEAEVVEILRGDDEGLQRRAAGVLAQIGSHAGDTVLKGWLAPGQDERAVQAALGTLLGLESDVYPDVRPLLAHPLMSVRTRLADLLVRHGAAYLDAVHADLGTGDLSDRARRTILDVLVRAAPTPDAGDVLILQMLLEHPDWGMRADAARLLRRWASDEAVDEALLAPALASLDLLLATESDPYVRFCAQEERAR